MFQLAFSLAGILLELATFAADGMLSAMLMMSGFLVGAIHLIVGSWSFQALIDRLTGCDLPECQRVAEWKSPLIDRADFK